ncbi:MAG: hypothetical protein V4726_01205 [Verrucomicrobiota bacterium]
MPRLFSHTLPAAAGAMAALLLLLTAAPAAPVPVGRAFEMGDVLIPGPELRAKPVGGAPAKAVVRIKAVYPHGTAGFRYDLVVIPMVPGTLNVADFLEPADGKPAAAALPSVSVEAEGVLPPGPPSLLTAPPPLNPDSTGGYSRMLPWFVLAWLFLGMGLLWSVRKKTAAAALPAADLTPEDRLRPLVESALVRPLKVEEKAEIERLILVRERGRLGLAGAADPAVWRAMRADPAAAPWLATLESWLHRPSGPPPAEKDLRALLSSLPSSTP